VIARILVLRGGALGDFMITLPALRLLRKAWPAARIELVGNARAAKLGVLGGYLDRAHSQQEARWSALYSTTPLPPTLVGWLQSFDLVLSFWPDPDGALAGHFPLRDGQIFLNGTAAPATAPAARHFCEPLRSLGLTTDDFCSQWPLTAAADAPGPLVTQPSPAPDSLGSVTSDPWSSTREAPAHLPPAGSIAIHPGSGSAVKNWPDERWLELVALLDAPILLILGEVELGRWNAPLVERLSFNCRRRLQVANQLPLPELARTLRKCRLFIGHDTGISHLAAAVGQPCVLLFGPTDPAMWAPTGPDVRVIRRGGTLDSISVHDVLQQCGRA